MGVPCSCSECPSAIVRVSLHACPSLVRHRDKRFRARGRRRARGASAATRSGRGGGASATRQTIAPTTAATSTTAGHEPIAWPSGWAIAKPARKTATSASARGRPSSRRQRRPHASAPRNSTIPPSARTPVISATAKPSSRAPAAIGQVGSARIGRTLATGALRPVAGGVRFLSALQPPRPAADSWPEGASSPAPPAAGRAARCPLHCCSWPAGRGRRRPLARSSGATGTAPILASPHSAKTGSGLR